VSEVFISYRRQDSEQVVERLFGALKASLQDASVFRDLGGIEIGEDWMDKIREAIDECYAFLVVIGPDWFELDDSGQPRINKRDDVVRREIERALKRVSREEAEIIPVLTSGAAMPAKRNLPGKLKQLHRVQARKLRDSRFEKDIRALCARITAIVVEKRKSDPKHWTTKQADDFLDSIGSGPLEYGGMYYRDVVPGRWQCRISSGSIEQQPWFSNNGRATLEFYVPAGTTAFEGVWEGSRRLTIEGSWMFNMDPNPPNRVFGVRLQGVADSVDPFDIEIPTSDAVGEIFRGTDQFGRHYALRLLEKAGI